MLLVHALALKTTGRGSTIKTYLPYRTSTRLSMQPSVWLAATVATSQVQK